MVDSSVTVAGRERNGFRAPFFGRSVAQLSIILAPYRQVVSAQAPVGWRRDGLPRGGAVVVAFVDSRLGPSVDLGQGERSAPLGVRGDERRALAVAAALVVVGCRVAASRG